MGLTGSLLTAPVGMGDISSAVGYSSLDLGTLVANGTIKKWALHKPVRLASNADTVSDISSYSTWINYMQNNVVKTDGTGSAPFGLLVGTSSNIHDVIGDSAAPTVDWEYQKPPSTGTFWRRMLDFNGYTKEPNPPMNAISDFTYYKASDVTNIIEIDTNDGAAGNTSIPVSILSQLNNYQLLLAIKENSNSWYYTIMSGTIMSSVDETNRILFTLPSGLSLSNSTYGYDAYLVGVTTTAPGGGQWTTGQWNQSNDAGLRSLASMIPLPFDSYTDCHFKFKVASDPDTNVVHYNYTIYIDHSYVAKYVEFNVSIYRNVSPPTSFTVQFDNVVAHPDYDDSANFPFTGEIFLFGGSTGQAFTYDSTTRKSSATIKRDVSSFNYTLDSYPNLTFNKSNSSNYSWIDEGFTIKEID